jgi:hypothetical protein
MSNNIIKLVTSDKRPQEAAAIEAGDVLLLPADQHLVIDAYFAGETDQRTELSLACDRLGVPADVNCSPLAAAAGQILIQGVQEGLPQWSTYPCRRACRVRPQAARLFPSAHACAGARSVIHDQLG